MMLRRIDTPTMVWDALLTKVVLPRGEPMSTMATNIRGGLTRLQVGTAACAVAAAAAFPAVVANAEPIHMPAAPVTQILIDAPLSPIMNIAELPEQPWWWLDNDRTVIDRFGALVFAVVGAAIAPIAAVRQATQAIVTAVQRFFQIGPYSTGRG